MYVYVYMNVYVYMYMVVWYYRFVSNEKRKKGDGGMKKEEKEVDFCL